MSAFPRQSSEADAEPPASAPPDVGYVLDALKLGLDQELQLSQRLRDRARQVFVLAVAFFTVVQTVAFNAFAQGRIVNNKTDLIVVLALAIAAIVFLGITAWFVLRADAPSRASDLDVSELTRLLNATYEGDPRAAGELGSSYLGILESRREANDVRVKLVGGAQAWGLFSILITTSELIVSLALRIP